ncbi:MAG: protein kinase [Desulfomonile tiedjei]|uniref:Protein kinase n=1 Tax=Desulfomonile tiedjei TaxID=2358 RepID=A0A9D6Z297_9BACT|nr:protein kinase [Desulfomonile tiedjei]
MTEIEVKETSSSKSRQVVFEPVTFGRYRLIDQISKGGMSDIFLAKISSVAGFQKPLVIKKLLPQYANKPRYVRRFINEARTLSRLNHANIVQVTDMGVIDSEYYIAMEYVEGRNIAHILSKASKTGHRPSMEFIFHVALEVARGLAYAHKRRGPGGENLVLVHQDVNAFNVMMSYEAEVKIIDFGIAQAFLDKSNRSGFPVAGKLLYFSPEQIQRKQLDRRVDIYGTGVLLYELLTGERLIKHQETVSDTIKMILQMDISKKLEEDANHIPAPVKPILMKAMALKPDDRYTWMEDMTADLRQVAKKLRLNIDYSAMSAYMKEQFTRELVLDKRRMRKLLADEFPRRGLPGTVDKAIKGSALCLLDRLVKLRSGSFRDVAGIEPGEIESGLRTLKFNSGKVIFRQGDTGTDIYVVEKGKVRVFFNVGNMRQTIATVGHGEFFGDTSLVENVRSVSALADEDCVLLAIDKVLYEKLMGNDTAREVVTNLEMRIRDVVCLLESSLLEDSLSKLIHALLFFQRRTSNENGSVIELAELADVFRLESNTQTVRYLEKLQSLEILSFDDRVIRVANCEKLENVLNVLSGRGKLTLKL